LASIGLLYQSEDNLQIKYFSHFKLDLSKINLKNNPKDFSLGLFGLFECFAPDKGEVDS